MFGKAIVRSLLAVAVVCCSVAAQADVFNMGTGLTNLETVWIGNPGNTADTATHSGNPAGQGAVGYVYQMGKYEVTAAQYTDFLNCVAASDTYGLYNTSMWSDAWGCKIQQSGTSGSFAYSVASGYANRPVNFVSWYDSIRFVNWLQNNQGGSGSTEYGTYTISGTGPNWTVDIPDAATRATWTAANKHWVLPSEDEWYKAAYHKNDGATGNYWDYPTGSNSIPGRDMTEATNAGNNANYYGSPYPIDSPYYTTVAGEFQLSGSAYGTFDQGGNVWERNEALMNSWRGVRGGSFFNDSVNMLASNRNNSNPTGESNIAGFRVACIGVPEPGSAVMLAGIALAALLCWWRKHE